jgi:ParB/RepB/Spo0J family partition protein
MSEQQLATIPIALLVSSGKNPRTEMRGLEDLADNIRQHGLLQPIVVRPRENKFEIVVGERRVIASRLAGLENIPAIVRNLTDEQTDQLRLIENVHREDLTNAEKGDAVIGLWEDYPSKYPTFKSISQRLGVKYDTVLMWLRYSRKISPFVRDSVNSSTLGEDHARFLLKYDRITQDKLARVIIRNGLNTPQTRSFLRFRDEAPDAHLDELARKAIETEVVKVPLRKLPREIRDQVRRIAEKKPKRILHTKESERKRIRTRKETKRRDKARASKAMNTSPGAPPDSPSDSLDAQQVERLIREVTQTASETATETPEKARRVTQIVSEELQGLRRRLEMFPEKSRRIEPKFHRLEALTSRGVIPYTVWDFRYREDYGGNKDFHGNCSPQVVEQCVWRLTEQDDLVLDPMAGSGTSLDVCRKFNRKCIGYDIKPPADRNDIVQNDSRKIPLDRNSVDMIFIHPPYWNLATYTDAEEKLPDLSRAKTLREFLEMLRPVFEECFRVLKKGKFMCVLLGDLIREGKFVPLTRKAADLAEEIGFTDYGYGVKLAHGELSRKKSGVIVAEPVYTDNLKISHDLIMFFKKS